MLKPKDKNKKFNLDIFKTRKFKYGTTATIVTLLFIVFIVGINILVNLFDQKFNWSFDLTKNKVFELTDESKNYVKNLSKDVQIIILSNEDEFISNGEYYIQANNIIKQYAQNSDKIDLEYISLSENPTFTIPYNEENLQTTSIIVKSEDNHIILNATDLFDIQSYYYNAQPISSKAEQAMTSAILNVTSNDKIKVTFLQGFEEEDSTAFAGLLEKNGFEVLTQSALTEEIDPDSRVVVIYGPNRDLDNEIINKLNKYIYNNAQYGRNIIYVASPSKGSTPRLDKFLEDWNIKIGDGMVFETDIKKLLVYNNPFYAINDYVDYEYYNGIKNINIPVALAFCKPIEVLDEDAVDVLLKFSETSGIRPQEPGNNWSPSEKDLIGNIPSMVVSKKFNEDGAISRVSVVGTTIGLDSESLSRTSLNNSSYMLNVFKVFTNKEDTITIEPKSLAGEELGINAIQAIYLGLLFMVCLPLIVLAIGIFIWIKRRNR